MIEGQFAAVAAVHAPAALEHARWRSAAPARGGTLVYAGGHLGRLAVQDGAELTPTSAGARAAIAIDRWRRGGAAPGCQGAEERRRRHRAGATSSPRRPGRADRGRGERHDGLHGGVSARGGGTRCADRRHRQQPKHAIVDEADHPIWLDTGARRSPARPDEAGTAQRVALTMLSSLAMIRSAASMRVDGGCPGLKPKLCGAARRSSRN